MKKKIYIAGKISGLPMKETAVKFANATFNLINQGYDPINPVELVQNYLFENNYLLLQLSDNKLWKIAMRVCLKELVDCDGVLLLADYKDSRGALIESKLAIDLGIPTFHDIDKLNESWIN